MQLLKVKAKSSRVCIISIVRLVTISQITRTKAPWGSSSVYMWSLAELAAGIIFPCLATLRPLLRQIRKKRHTGGLPNRQSAALGRISRTRISPQHPAGESRPSDSTMDGDNIDRTDSSGHTAITNQASQLESDSIPLTGTNNRISRFGHHDRALLESQRIGMEKASVI